MPFHVYQAVRNAEAPRWFGIRIEFEDDRWVASCHETDPDGVELPAGSLVAPKFYGVTPDQAQRRVVESLENAYDEVVPLVAR